MPGLHLEVSQLAVTGAGGRVLVRADRLSVAPGEAIGIRGPSGAGKSTLLFALAGLQPSTSGSINWGGVELLLMGEGERARFRRDHVGLVFQDFLLFEELTATGNAALAAAFCSRREAQPVRARAAALLERLGIGTGPRNVMSFSGGERQRVALARALANDPAIILADEPTASLDRETADRMIDDLLDLVRHAGKTLIAVSHDPHLLMRMDRRVDVIDGRLREGEAVA
ncbi:putative ABC transport system ATP-binding protein [Hoeflea marina]|uniref:Putative ABC transport system ATP-binding protein n=1 Tax=Hoeflea marina TaxID=274592 RepID=A0A317PHB9_9HYPH|nr:ATP-binding cassette domain-containing protein [Hoeflea marina]PWV98780.1 putative ABC transport system ATP-binding protein [Hoeflea marina]